MRIALPVLSLTLALAACGPPPAAPPPPPEILAGTAAVAMANVPGESLDRAVGTYANDKETLSVARSGDALYVTRPGLAPVKLSLVGLDTYAGPSGLAYLFDKDQLILVATDGTQTILAKAKP